MGRIGNGLIALMLSLPLAAQAQYYTTGVAPAGQRWNMISDDEVRIIFPKEGERMAARALAYMNAVRGDVAHGFRHGPMRTPVVFHGQTFLSNGIAMWAPKRIEFMTIPSSDTYATPWIKQLSVHEYRHNVQYNNLNRGWVRGASYLLGQQAPLAAIIMLPMWFVEGDATLYETQSATFGRGLQPSFTIDYRMYADEGAFDRFAMDKWFSGSYKDRIPDHYRLGYQMVSWTHQKYGHNIWDKVVRYTARNPYMIVPKNVALRKFYDTSVPEMFRETFGDLKKHWESIPRVENSAAVIAAGGKGNFTTYLSPAAIDGSRVVSIKNDFDRSFRIVVTDAESGQERNAGYIGSPGGQLTYADGKVWWTEFRQSTLWSHRVNSQLCFMDLDGGGARQVRGERRALYPVALGGGSVAVVEYDYDGTYRIKADGRGVTLPDSISVHGLTYDGATGLFYFIGLSDAGMWIGNSDLENFGMVTAPSRVTIANLNSHDGKLYFTSIASGKDEAHVLDLATGREYRITTSSYGSFAPSTADGKNIFVTTYTPRGYLLARQDIGEGVEVEPAQIPENVVNPARPEWGVVNIDTVRVEPGPQESQKRFRAGLRMLNFHSWAPVYFEPENIFAGRTPDIYAGVTLLSQDLIGWTTSTFQYAYTPGGSMFKASVTYSGLPVNLSFSTTYGGGTQDVAGSVWRLPLKDYFDAGLLASVPMVLSAGRNVRVLTPVVQLGYSNLQYYDQTEQRFREGRLTASASIQFVDNARMAYRDFLPRWGYAVNLGMMMTPFQDKFGAVSSVYARTYLPGAAAHHSLKLAGYYFNQQTDYFILSVTPFLRPYGVSGLSAEHYFAAGADYQLPVWYPDGGIPSIVFVKRLRLNIAACGARYATFNGGSGQLYSYGGDVLVDLVPFRLPSNVNLTLTLSAHNSTSGMVYGFGLNIPF